MASGNTSNRQQDSTLKQVQDVNEDSHSQVHAGFAASTVGNKSSEEQLELHRTVNKIKILPAVF